MKSNLRMLCVLVLATGITSFSLAQVRQTGVINGTVTDEEGVPLPGVSVSIESPALIIPEMSTFSNQNGFYRFPALPPGTYQITYELDGFNRLVRKGIIIRIGRTSTVDVVLQIESIEETITVVGEAPTIDKQSTTGATNLDKTLIASVPAERDLGSYFALTPGVTNEPTQPGETQNWGHSAHGTSVRDNSYNLDGVNLADALVGVQNVEFGMDVMEELSIESGGLPAEYGDAKGAVINVVTKSGGNRFSGSAGFYYKSEALQSTNTTGTVLEGEESGFNANYEPSFTLGGPFIKDKLWFFASLSYQRLELIAPPGFPVDQELESDYIIKRNSFLPYFKLSFQPGPSDRFTVSYNYSSVVTPEEGASALKSIDTLWRRERYSHVFHGQWTHFFSQSLFMNLKAAYVYADHNLKPNKRDVLWIDLATGEWSGGISFNQLFHYPRLQINFDATYFVDDLAGSHEFKLGGEFTSVNGRETDDVFPNEYGIYFGYKYFGVPYMGIYMDAIEQKWNMRNYFAFVQDTWSLTNRLVFNLGLRFAHQRGIVPAQNEEAVSREFLGVTFTQGVADAFTPLKWTSLSPRLGMVYDITGDGKTLFKASYSRYTQANIFVNFMFTNPNSALSYVQLLFPDGRPIPGAYVGVGYPRAASVGYKGHEAEAPYLDELIVGLEREFLPNWSLSLRYIKKWDRNLIEDIDANSLDADKLMDEGELIWTNWEPVTFTDPYDGSRKIVYNQLNTLLQPDLYLVNPPDAERDYDGVEVKLSKRYANGWMIFASYVWSKSRGIIGTDFTSSQPTAMAGLWDNPNVHINAVGRFSLERRHQFQLYGFVKGPLGINLGGTLRMASGQRYTRSFNTINAGVVLNQVSETIRMEERGARGYPMLWTFDLRAEKAFHLGGTAFLKIFADGFNIFNNNAAISVQTVYGNTLIPFEQALQLQDPRIFRIGAKLEF